MAAGVYSNVMGIQNGNPGIGGKMNSDERNTSFAIPAQVAEHKPGFDTTVAKHPEHGLHSKSVRRQPSDPKSIPQTPLAQRLRELKKGAR
jgi:hypothetical protein